jgi:glycosyltransferase involved in cell wall biosynthesis
MLTKWSTRRASAVTVVSRDLGERLETMGWSRPMQVIQNGVQLDVFRPHAGREGRNAWRARVGIPNDAFLIASFARFVPGKRHADLIEAARILRRTGTRVFLLLAGQGPSRIALVEQMRNDPDSRVIEPIDDVAGALRDVDALVLCSDHEAHPRIVLEAMSSGVPCVVTNVGGMPEIVGSGPDRGGLLVPARDPGSLAGALGSLASDPELRSQIGAAARRRAERFSFEIQWAAYRDLWNDVIRRRGADSAGASGSGSAARSDNWGT